MVFSPTNRVRLVAVAMALTALGTSIVWACQVPVFRYALERWEADGYTVIFTPGKSGELTAKETEAFDFLREAANSDEFPANLLVKLSVTPAPDSDAATMALVYPQKVRGLEQSPIWSGAATVENARKIFDSPARREIVKQILSGQSAVWLVVESGDEALDSKAVAAMETVIKDAPGTLKIPDGVIEQSDIDSIESPTNAPIDPENILQSNVPLKIDFGMIRISRDDPAEAVFLQMLLGLEADLGEFSKEPMVFPIFGRGRVLEPLIGRGVTRDNAMDYAGYLTGACSCEVKDQNPGMDLLVAANWDLALEGSQIIIEKILPPLEGLTSLGDAAAAVDEAPIAVAADEPETQVFPLVRPMSFVLNMWWVVIGAVVIGVIAIGSVVIVRKKKS